MHKNMVILYALGIIMRTTLDLNENLLADAMKWTGETTKTAVINEALKQVIKSKKRKNQTSHTNGNC